MEASIATSAPPSRPVSGEIPPTAAAAVRRADWLLRSAVILFALGLARAWFTRAGSAFGSVALLEWDVSHAHILLAEKLVAALLLLAALSLIVRPTTLALGAIAAVVFAESCAAVRAGGVHFFELTPYANALRYLTPLALAPLIPSPDFRLPRTTRCHISAWMLRIGIAVVFTIHGIEAWKLHPHFIDYIIGTGRNLGGYAISEAAAESALKVIAAVDLAVAVLVLLRPSPVLLFWMAFWGLATALSRPLSLGFASYPEVLLRASHFLAPLALWQLLVWLKTTRSAPPPAAETT